MTTLASVAEARDLCTLLRERRPANELDLSAAAMLEHLAMIAERQQRMIERLQQIPGLHAV